MSAKCIKCGSERTHTSRVRRGERTVGMLLLKPVRCRDCRERFWVRNPAALLAAWATLAGSALFAGAVWLIVMYNFSDEYIKIKPRPGSDRAAVDGETSPDFGEGRLHGLKALTAPDAPDGQGVKPSGGKRSPDATKPPRPLADSPGDHLFAVRLYQDNAEKGKSDAQYKLGLLYLTGNGAVQDFAEAAKWLKLSAEQGYPLAQYELGLIYRTGQGLTVDPMQSYIWLNLAAAAGVEQAVTMRDEVMRLLSAQQLVQAQKSSREWLASRPKPDPPAEEASNASPGEQQPKADGGRPDSGERAE